MIEFKTIRYKNILSTGNAFTEISLNDQKTTLIVGENGAGKSTVLDALSFALYGKPFRRINKPQLMNSINQKDLLVELDFRIGRDEYSIRRGVKLTSLKYIRMMIFSTKMVLTEIIRHTLSRTF